MSGDGEEHVSNAAEAAYWRQCVDKLQAELNLTCRERDAAITRLDAALTHGDDALTESARHLAQRDEARAERNAARERLTLAEAALRQAAGCLVPEELFDELGFEKFDGEWVDDAEFHLEAKRAVDDYFARFPDAKEEKP